MHWAQKATHERRIAFISVYSSSIVVVRFALQPYRSLFETTNLQLYREYKVRLIFIRYKMVFILSVIVDTMYTKQSLQAQQQQEEVDAKQE